MDRILEEFVGREFEFALSPSHGVEDSHPMKGREKPDEGRSPTGSESRMGRRLAERVKRCLNLS